MQEGYQVVVNGEISKVETFTTAGGGLLLKVRIPDDGKDSAAKLLHGVQRVAEITFDFIPTHEKSSADDDSMQMAFDEQ